MARRKPATVHGLLAIDKPAGITSHDVVDRVRRLLHERKVGHSGTLDPDATGVLLLGVGDATRLLRYLDVVPGGSVESPVTSKAYTAEVVLGTETSTLDASGEVTATHDMSEVVAGLTIESLQRVVDANLSGPIMQVPPMVSALKVDGKRLHELAREGIEVEREARPVMVHRFEVSSIVANIVHGWRCARARPASCRGRTIRRDGLCSPGRLDRRQHRRFVASGVGLRADAVARGSRRRHSGRREGGPGVAREHVRVGRAGTMGRGGRCRRTGGVRTVRQSQGG
jgi:tRNA pseudouridine(55) synthase